MVSRMTGDILGELEDFKGVGLKVTGELVGARVGLELIGDTLGKIVGVEVLGELVGLDVVG